MSPLHVEILLFYWYTGGEDFPRVHVKMISEIVERFAVRGLLVRMVDGNNPKYVANREALKPYIDAVLAVPLPEQRWVMP